MDVPYDVRRVDHRAAVSRDYAKVEQQRDRIRSWKNLDPDGCGETRMKWEKR